MCCSSYVRTAEVGQFYRSGNKSNSLKIFFWGGTKTGPSSKSVLSVCTIVKILGWGGGGKDAKMENDVNDFKIKLGDNYYWDGESG